MVVGRRRRGRPMRQSVRGRSCVVGLVIGGLLGSGCGSRRDHAAFVAADRLARTAAAVSPAGQVGDAGPDSPVPGQGSAVAAPSAAGVIAPATAPSAASQRTTPSATGVAGSGAGAGSGRTSTAPTGPTGAAGPGSGSG